MNNNVILITGSSRGIGAHLVCNFAKRKYKVVINYSKSEQEAIELYNKALIYSESESLLCVKADVSNRDMVNKMFDQIYDKFGRCDVIVNNAGINIDRPFLEMSLKDWKKVLDTILTGTFNCSQEFTKR